MKRISRRHASTSRYNWTQTVAPIALALTVAAGGAWLAFYQTRKTSSQVSSATVQEVNPKKEALPPNLDGLLPLTIVQELASSAKGRPVTDVTLENHSDTLVYAVTLDDGTKLGFDATSGNGIALQGQAVTDTTPLERTQDKKDRIPADFMIRTSFEEAQKLAQEAFPNGTISRIKLTAKDRMVVLNVSFTDKAEIDIDAANGSVLRVKTPTGATAVSPSDETSPNTPMAPGATESTPNSPQNNHRPDASQSSGTPQSPSDDPDKTSGKTPIVIEGTLSLANDTYTITVNDVTYAIVTDRKDISGLVGKTVEVEGKLQSENRILATKVEPRR